MTILQTTGLFLLNLLLAWLGTAVLEAEIPVPLSLGWLLIKDIVVAACLGIFAKRLLKSETAKWVWLAGLCWFLFRAASLWIDQRPVRGVTGGHSVSLSALDSIVFGLPLLRTSVYSAAAALSSWWWHRLQPVKEVHWNKSGV